MKPLSMVMALGLLMGSLHGQSRPTLDSALQLIRADSIRAHMAFLADDRLEGRGPGTQGHKLAARYVAAQFEAMGLQPLFGTSYFQPVPLRRAQPIEGETTMALHRGSRHVRLRYAKDFVTEGDVYREMVSLTTPVVFVGFGTAAAEFGYDDYAGTDVRGKTVAFLPGVASTLASVQREYFGALDVRLEAAIERGAAGVLLLSPDADFPWELSVALARQGATKWLDAAQRPSSPSRPLAFAVLSFRATRSLFRLGSRDMETVTARLKAGERQSVELPITVSLHGRSRHTRLESSNVGAKLPGSDSGLSKEHLIYTAHLDHLGRGAVVDGDDIYNGAIDNASGVAAMLALARAFAAHPERPRRSIVFLAPTAEESGGVGSDYFAAHSPVPLSEIVAAINIDAPTAMLYPPHTITGLGAEHSTLGAVAAEAVQRFGLHFRSAPLAFRSDSPPFVRQGVPALRLITSTETGRADLDGETLTRGWITGVYHTPRDDMTQRLDFDALVQHARMNYLIGHHVGTEANRPRWHDGDFFARAFERGRGR